MSMRRENGQMHVRWPSDRTLEAGSATADNVRIFDLSPQFCAEPGEYDWEYAGKQDMIVPYKNTAKSLAARREPVEAEGRNFQNIRWEKRRVWIVEGTLRRGESNVLARRRFYLDETSWDILLGEGYDTSGRLVTYYMRSDEAQADAGSKGHWYST